MTDKVCRWGILGAANIARKNWQAIRLAGNSTLIAVASRSRDRAQQIIDDCQSHVPFATKPQALGSYEELIASHEIDAIYIPLPTGLRTEWVVRAAQAGKHVLVEKPVGATSKDVETILAACKMHNVQFMDGVMFMHSARLPKMREVLDDGHSIGDVRRIGAQFSFRGGDDFLKQNIRVDPTLEPLGCLGDLGWYTIRFSLCAMNYAMPISVTARTISAHGAVPTEMTMDLMFAHGVTASNYCSFLTENHQWANISGTKGYLHVRDFVLPFVGSEVSFTVTNATYLHTGCDFNAEDHTRRVSIPEYGSGAATSQETNMIRTFAELVLSGRREDSWGEMALKTQRVIDACLTSAQQGGSVVSL